MSSGSQPLPVPGITGAVAVSSAELETCAVIAGGSIRCCGYNCDGELGNGPRTNRTLPRSVSS